MTNLVLCSIGALVGSTLFICAGSTLSHQPILKVPLPLTVQDGSVTRFGNEAFSDIKQGFETVHIYGKLSHEDKTGTTNTRLGFPAGRECSNVDENGACKLNDKS